MDEATARVRRVWDDQAKSWYAERESLLADSRPVPHDWQPGILALADRGRLQSLVEGARFTSTTVEAVDMTWRFASADAYWTWLTDVTALGPLLRGRRRAGIGSVCHR